MRRGCFRCSRSFRCARSLGGLRSLGNGLAGRGGLRQGGRLGNGSTPRGDQIRHDEYRERQDRLEGPAHAPLTLPQVAKVSATTPIFQRGCGDVAHVHRVSGPLRLRARVVQSLHQRRLQTFHERRLEPVRLQAPHLELLLELGDFQLGCGRVWRTRYDPPGGRGRRTARVQPVLIAKGSRPRPPGR